MKEFYGKKVKYASAIRGKKILFIGAHCDDIEIGCGGTAAKLKTMGRSIAFVIAAECGEARKSEAQAAAKILGLSETDNTLFFGNISLGRLEYEKDVLKSWLKGIEKQFKPDTVFVHRGNDSHSDHSTLYDVSIRVFNNQTFIIYAIPKPPTQDTPFEDNYREDISDFIKTKLELCGCHKSQANKPVYLDPENIKARAYILHGNKGYSEAFNFHRNLPPAEDEHTDTLATSSDRPNGPVPPLPAQPRIELNNLEEYDPRNGKGGFVNREKYLKLLNKALKTNATNVVELVAWSGVGKTSLIKYWLRNKLPRKSWCNVKLVYAWKFNEAQANEDMFFRKALEWFRLEPIKGESLPAMGRRLADTLILERTLLILDGVERLQNPPGSEGGKLRSRGLESLLLRFATGNHNSLCVLTTHQTLRDLNDFEEPGVIVYQLENLEPSYGAHLLYELGVRLAGQHVIKDDDNELQAASKHVHGHAMTLQLLGTYLSGPCKGDVRKYKSVNLDKADREGKYNTFEMLKTWEKWFIDGGEVTSPQLAALRLMGLFNREVGEDCLSVLQCPPIISGLITEATVKMSEKDWNAAFFYLEECRLVTRPPGKSPSSSHQSVVDCHSLIREYFAKQLRENYKDSFKAAHFRLYKYFQQKRVKFRPTEDALQPLYDAIRHGCFAGYAQEAYDKIYIARIHRIKRNIHSILGHNSYYATEKLGAFSRDYVAVNCFFEDSWENCVDGIDAPTRVELLRRAAFLLHGLGRVNEIREPLECAENFLLAHRKDDWKNRAAIAADFSMMEWRVGNLSESVRRGRQAVKYSDKAKHHELKITSRINYAYALLLVGKYKDAISVLQQADEICVSKSPPYLYDDWLLNFRIFELLLVAANRASWLRFMGVGIKKATLEAAQNSILKAEEKMRTIRLRGGPKLGTVVDAALYNLILGRLAMYKALCFNDRYAEKEKAKAREYFRIAIDKLKSIDSGAIPIGMVSQAWLRQLYGDEKGARADLDEAWQTAKRGAMACHQVDIHLYRARLFRDKGELEIADDLMKNCGYMRRKKEFQDAKKAILS